MMIDNSEYVLLMKDGHLTNIVVLTQSLVEIFVQSQMVRMVEDVQFSNNPIENCGRIHRYGLKEDYQLKGKMLRSQQNGNFSWM